MQGLSDFEITRRDLLKAGAVTAVVRRDAPRLPKVKRLPRMNRVERGLQREREGLQPQDQHTNLASRVAD
jgi:hypothetical protein